MTLGPPAPTAQSTPSAKLRVGLFAAVGLVAAFAFAMQVDDPPFVDEYAYITQSYYADVFLEARGDDPAWLEFPAYDLVPLPKYLIGGALRVAGEPRPGPEAARGWYQDTSRQYGPPRVLRVSRMPSIALGALACVALVAIGNLAFGPATGVAAAILLMINPLFALHAHRAMSESPCEAFLLVALAFGLAAWSRAFDDRPGWLSSTVLMTAAGAAVGLSVLAKFNGLLGLMTFAAWGGLAWAVPRATALGRFRYIVGIVASGLAAAALFVALDPFMTARPTILRSPEAARIAGLGPWGRFRLMIDHRRTMSAGQQQTFPHNALTKMSERAKVVAAQGFGRFGPLGPRKSDSTRRYDFDQDWGAFAWLPLCLASLGYALAFGHIQQRRKQPPAAWAVMAWALVSLGVVTLYLPMAWDRYQLPIQAPFALLAGAVLVAFGDAILRAVGLKPRVEPT